MKNNKLLRLLIILFSILALLFPAIRLGYPILHGDSGVYIVSGFEHFAPIERPITYGLFVWISSLSYSLWFVVLTQAVITTFVLHVLLNRLLGKNHNSTLLFVTIAILALTTSTGYFVCQIKPDFFLPLILLAIYSLLIGPGEITLENVLLGLVIMIGLLSHLSHLPIITGLIFATLLLTIIFRKLRFDLYIRKYLLLLLMLLSAWMIAPSINYLYTGSFKLSRVSNIFSVSRMLQAGIFQEYVRDSCAKDSTFLFCKYGADLNWYKNYYDFLWDKNSFLYDHECVSKGKQNCWIIRNEEFGILIRDIYSQKKYLRLLVNDAFKTSIKQFFAFDIPSYASFQHHSYPGKMVRSHLPADNYFLENAKQNNRRLRFPIQNLVQNITIIASVLLIILLIIRRKGSFMNARFILLGYMIILLLIGNAAFIGIFAGSSDRFQSRLIWLVPLYALLLFYHIYGEKILLRRSQSLRAR